MQDKPPIRSAVEKEGVARVKQLYLEMPQSRCPKNAVDPLGLYTLVM